MAVRRGPPGRGSAPAGRETVTICQGVAMPDELAAEPRVRHVVVVGGGIAGLAAARALHQGARRTQPPVDLRVTVLEASGQVGGKLRVSDLAGVPVDEGAESLLLRRPEAVSLARAVGLGPDLEDAATTTAAIWTRGGMHPMPGATVMGVPSDLRSLAASGLLTGRELARVPVDSWLPRTRAADDVSVGRYVTARLGRAVVDRLVEPLLGGVYAGRADELSLAATLPQLAPHARRERSLLAAARASRAVSDEAGQDGAVFGAPRGGVGRLPGAVARLSGATVRTGATVRELARTPGGWRLVIGPTRSPEEVLADAVVLAVPAAPAARLLRPHAPSAASELAQIRYSSMAVVALAFPVTAFPRPPAGSGFLVPPVEGRAVKAVTFSSTKWGWYAGAAPGLVLVRASVGRIGEEAVLQRDDADLVDLVLGDLTDALGVADPPLDARVTRWGGGLPQYTVGHLGRVERVRAAVDGLPGLAVAGAAYDGVGVPACVASGERAAAEVLRQWGA
jgi:oxygen-dependent protoporphyrinogen oxidase